MRLGFAAFDRNERMQAGLRRSWLQEERRGGEVQSDSCEMGKMDRYCRVTSAESVIPYSSHRRSRSGIDAGENGDMLKVHGLKSA